MNSARYCFFWLLLFVALSAQSQAVRGVFVKAGKSGCLVFNPYPEPGDSVTYTGGCKEGYAQGQGTMVWYAYKNKLATYVGAMEKGRPNGRGSYTFHYNGQIQKGVFLDGEFIKLPELIFKNLKMVNLNIPDTGNVYQNDAGSTEMNFLFLKAKQAKPRGLVVLLPSFYEKMTSVINSSKLVEALHNSGFAVAVVPLNIPLILNENALQIINNVIATAIEQQNPEGKIYLGGFSIGGNHALRYTEISYEDANRTIVRPMAVFAIDPPVDLENLYARSERDLQRGSSELGKSESAYMIENLNKVLGGSPSKVRQKYVAESPYSYNEKEGGNAKNLRKTPVKIYVEPDIEWYIKNRRRDLRDINTVDCASMINSLVLIGNVKAEISASIGKGKRSDGTTHPHSWNIADPYDIIRFLGKK